MIICQNQHPDYPDDWIIVKQSDHDNDFREAWYAALLVVLPYACVR